MGGRANLSLPILDRLSTLGLRPHRRGKALTRRYFDRLRVRTPHMDAPVWSLSGGNQQKIAMAKWLASECGILLIDEPTRGVDVGAKAEIHALIDELAREGAAILLISSELPEVLNLSTRIIVLREGRQMGELSRAEASQEVADAADGRREGRNMTGWVTCWKPRCGWHETAVAGHSESCCAGCAGPRPEVPDDGTRRS